MKIKYLVVLLAVLTGCINKSDYSQNNEKQFVEFWKNKTAGKANSSSDYYHLFSGERYEKDYWTKSYDKNNDDLFLGEVVKSWDDEKYGKFFIFTSSSPSGDWIINSKNYYNPKGELIFVIWTLNVFSTLDSPITVERNFSFNLSGKLINKTERTYETETKKPIKNASYMDRDVIYWIKTDLLPFKDI